MFDIGWQELFVVAVVAIIVVGPKDLPKMLRAFGKTVGKWRKIAGDFQSQFNEAMRESELEDIQKDIHSIGSLKNPFDGVRDAISPLKAEIEKPEPVPLEPATATEPREPSKTKAPKEAGAQDPPVEQQA